MLIMNKELLDWTEKYRPGNLTEVIGHNKVIKDLLQWAQEWERAIVKDKALILYGKPGIGKTSAAFALAFQMDWDLIELNASDQRTAKIIQKIAGSASKMGTFSGISGRRLIILDEADNLHGNFDRGGARAIIQVIKQSSQPIILIANEFYEIDSALRLACRAVQFRALSSSSIVSVLKNICHKEGVMVGIDVLQDLSVSAGGDLRSAINDLQAVAIGKDTIEVRDIVTASRDTRETVFKAMDKIFRGHDLRSAQEASWHLDESPEDLINWIDENLPIGYTGNTQIASGFFMLSRADIFLGRVRRRQNYGFWRYASLLMTGGVASIGKHSGFIKFQSPSYWRKLAQTRAKRNIRDSTAGKIGMLCRVSKRYARSDLIWFFKYIMKSKKHSIGLAAELDLNPDEIAFLLDSKPATKKVENIYDSARQMIREEVEHDIEVFGGFACAGGIEQYGSANEDTKEETDKEQPGTENEIHSGSEPGTQRSLFDF
jgi:replication factor C large subunit